MYTRARLAVSGLAAAALLGCSTTGEAPNLPRVRLPRGAGPETPIYSGSVAVVYRSAFEAVVAEFDTSPRIVKPERGLLVFSEDGSDANTSILVSAAGDNAAAVHIETRNAGGLLGGRGGGPLRGRLIAALDERLARAEEVAPDPSAPKGSSALAEKQEALERINAALGFTIVPGYLIDMEVPDLQHLANAIHLRVGGRELTQAERLRSAELAVTLGKELHDTGRYEEALEALTHAVALRADYAVAHCNLGEIYKHLRDFDRCIHHLLEARRLDPGYVETYINLGIVYDDYVVDDAQALGYYREYLALGGTDPRVQGWIRQLEGAGGGADGGKEAR